MLGSAPESEVQEERIIMDVDGADLPFPDNSVDVGNLYIWIYTVKITNLL